MASHAAHTPFPGHARHVLHLYENGPEFLDLSARFIHEGLEAGEGCIWVAADPWNSIIVRSQLAQRGLDVQAYLDRQHLQILPFEDWYGAETGVDASVRLEHAMTLVERMQRLGWRRIRACGNAFQPLSASGWEERLRYECGLHETLSSAGMLGLCSYRTRSLPQTAREQLLNSHHAVLDPAHALSQDLRPSP